jgi:hypothetical protein
MQTAESTPLLSFFLSFFLLTTQVSTMNCLAATAAAAYRDCLVPVMHYSPQLKT